MPGGGTLRITTGMLEVVEAGPVEPGGYATLSVQDDGAGMDESTRLRAFEPFFTTKPVGEGTGLGLSTVYAIVTKAGGHLTLESAPGQGTRITAIFPVVPAKSAPEAPSVPPTTTTNNQGTLLLVEDDELVREAVHHYLSRAGFDVVEACDGEDALALCAALSRTIDLVITDMALPKLSGETLARELARLRPETPILFVSAHSTQELRRLGRLPEGARSLQKPFEASSLLAQVNLLLGSKS